MMKNSLMRLYQVSPYPLKVLAATLRGLQLRKWRYGKSLDILFQEVLDRETWGREKWVAWQEERLVYILHRAATQVPYYQNHWRERRRKGDNVSYEVLNNWPILTKDEVKDNPKALVAADCKIDELYVDHTSGTTGKPLDVYESRRMIQHWYAINEVRTRHWHKVSMHDNWGIFGGQLVTDINRNKPPYWVQNLALNQIYFSSFHISADTVIDYIWAMEKFNITHLVVYPSSLTFLASLLVKQKVNPPKNLQVIFCNAEVLLPQQKQIMELAFKCPVVNTYGMGEKVFGASECENYKMHVWPEAGIAEVWDEDKKIFYNQPDQIGDYVFTGLMNSDMLLVRYQLGDRGTLPVWDSCSCGRPMPVMGRLEGRSDDMITTSTGRKLFWFNSVFYGKPIVESQIVQESLERITVNVVPEANFSEEDELALKQAMLDRVGDGMEIVINRVDSIQRTKTGKLKTIVSYVD